MGKQVVVHRLDWFTRVILLFIGCVLLGFLLKPMVQPKAALGTSSDLVKVNLDQIGGWSIGHKAIPIIVVEP